MSFYTYLHCKPTGEIFYVGKGTGRRAYDVRRNNKHHSDVVKHYGAENIQVFVFPCDSEEQALEDEIQQIRQLRKEGVKLANVTDGGDGTSGYHHGDEAKEIISKTHKGRKKSDETCKRMSESQKKAALNRPEIMNGMFTGQKHRPESIEKMRAAKAGKKHTAEHSQKISESLKGHSVSVESRLKSSQTQKGRTFTEEHRKKLSESLTGRKLSDETRRKMSESKRKKKSQDVQLQIDLGVSNVE